ncbi:Dyp-type peroxidase [Microbacterium suaedae]|uniref:Dyp-type peroxidase n=1 Tax=Microbacterium suaedae TaxID=2067813 RepID=UPI000DA17C76|nr:Dyp-type peroxidase [Microbacterium suaedae]
MTKPRRGAGRIRRRDLFAAGGAAAVAGILGWGARAAGDRGPGAAMPAPSPAGQLRAGITDPAVPQRHAIVTVFEMGGRSDDEVLAAARAVRDAAYPVPDDAGRVTLTIGFALRRARSLWPARCGADDLPSFANDADDVVTGGDLVLQVCAETASALLEVASAAARMLGSPGAVWSERGYRDAPTEAGTSRTPVGFIDGIANPRTSEERDAGVWSDPERGDTFMVARRMTISEEFVALSRSHQEHAIGRRRGDGSPLSGGGPLDDVDLFAKSPDGALVTPLHAHARRAHPAYIGRGLMLRRSYGFDAPPGSGLLFLAFVADPETFTLTQRRLDEADDLIRHTRTNASGCFFIPGDDW